MYVDMDTSGAADLLTWMLPHSCRRFVLCPLFSIAPLHKYLAHAGLQTQVHVIMVDQPLITAMGLSFTASLEMPASWHVFTTSVTSCTHHVKYSSRNAMATAALNMLLCGL